MDQVKGVLTLQGEALTQAVSFLIVTVLHVFEHESLIFKPLAFLLMFGLSYQDINLKVAKNSQALHFQFREDKQWKLQQVLYASA